MSTFDLLVRGGTIADGLGGTLKTADVGVRNGKIIDVGKLDGTADRVLDADGALVTPGFVDTHSHYDGQILWDAKVWSSSLHGTTTVINGNCGVGFAPADPRYRQQLIEIMESIEEIPERSLQEGIDWKWGTVSEMLDTIGRHDIDVAIMVAHNPVRLAVMGERALAGAPATEDDVAQMAEIVSSAMDSGAAGFSSSRGQTHRTKTGEPVPSRFAEKDELVAIARAMNRRGMFQIAAGGRDGEELRRERAIEQAVADTGVCLVVPVVAGGDGVTVPTDAWENRMSEIEETCATGAEMWAQVAPRPVGVLLGLHATMNPFSGIPAYEEIAHLPIPDRVRAMRDPGVRNTILAGVGKPRVSGRGFQGILRVEAFDQMWELADVPCYEPHPSDSIEARAERLGCEPAVLAYDIVTAEEGERLFYFTFFGYADFNLDRTRDLMLHERAIVGLGDGGAHLRSVCDSSYPTTMLSYWGRDRKRGERLDVSWIVQSLTSRPAQMAGFKDRGVIAPGFKADLNVIDFDNLRMQRPRFLPDFPGNEDRLVQGSDGILATIVSGVPVYEYGRHTGALPGRVVRNHIQLES